MKKTDKDRWIEDTQLFQSIAGVKVESYEILSQAYDENRTKKKNGKQ